MKRFNVALHALIVAMFAVAFAGDLRQARADLLYSTGFEIFPFVPGQTVNGRGSFAVVSGNPASMVITNSNVYDGSQSLEMIGGQLGGGPYFFQSAATINPNYDALANQRPVITLEAHARLDGPNTDTGNDTLDDQVSVNLDALLADNSYFSTFLSSDGQAYGYINNNYVFSGPAALGQYHDLQLVLDFNRNTSSFLVDGHLLGTEPFDSSIQSTQLSSAELSMNGLFQPTQYTAYADDFSVSATPEPASGLLLLSFAGAVEWLHRQRRTR